MNDKEFVLLENFYNFWDPDGTKDINEFITLAITSLVNTGQINRSTLATFQKSKMGNVRRLELREKIRELENELANIPNHESTVSESHARNDKPTFKTDPCGMNASTISRSTC